MLNKTKCRNLMSDIPMREMDLAEILATLPQGHKARIQFGELTARLSEEKDKVFELEQQAELSFNENATFQIKGGQLVFAIGFQGLKRSIEHDTHLIVTDNVDAVKAIKQVICFEDEDGRTLFHQMLAGASYQAHEDGELGFDIKED